MGITTVALLAKPKYLKKRAIFASASIPLGALLPGAMSFIWPSLSGTSLATLITVSGALISLAAAWLLQTCMVFARYATKEDWKSSDSVIIQGFSDGSSKGYRGVDEKD